MIAETCDDNCFEVIWQRSGAAVLCVPGSWMNAGTAGESVRFRRNAQACMARLKYKDSKREECQLIVVKRCKDPPKRKENYVRK